MRKLAFVFIFISSFIAIRLVAAPSSRPLIAMMQYQPADSDLWDADAEVDDEGFDHDYYKFAAEPKVDLNISRMDEDLATELNSKGKDALIADILKGQNIINNLFGVGETVVLDSKLDRDSDVSVLTLHTKQQLPDGEYERVAKYYISMGQYLQAELRWKTDVDSSTVKKARKSFESGKMSLAGVKEASR
jgi:hypothetical protein